jgi:cation-transporting ATPase E
MEQRPQLAQSAISPTPPTDLGGLSEAEAVARRSQGLGNDVKFRTSRPYKQILFENVFTFFNIVLFILGLLLVLLGKPTEAFITTGVVFTNVIVATIQEVRAKRKLDHIALLTRPKAKVVREGVERAVDPAEIVLGDVLVVEPGDQVVVDGAIVGDGRIDVDESLLTGESALAPKQPGDDLYSGSFCVTGRATYEVQKVGVDSLANQLTKGARSYTREYTPLQREVNLIIRVLLALIVFFGALVIIGAVLNERPVLESVRATSVLFGLAPSSLFLMIVIAYAVGAVRIADKGALVQRANSIESLCNVTVLCLDKTGTLTANRIALDHIRPVPNSGPSPPEEELRRILGDFAHSTKSGNRTSEAIAASYEGDERELVDEVPFSSARQWSAVSFNHEDRYGVFVLGAPEVLQYHLTKEVGPLTPAGIRLKDEVTNLAKDGYRVLLFAHKQDLVQLHDQNGEPELPSELSPLCLLCFTDELRPEARKTLEGFAVTGVDLKLISGDNPLTVAALAKRVGMGDDGPLKVVSGRQLESLDDDQLALTARETNIFGRITPQQKEKLVRVLRQQGNYVAMTGDGVNDVLALKQANLGIAMQSGSQATRSVADIVLLNDSFAVLPETFSEGQRILTGMQDILRLYLTRILYLAILIVAVSMIGRGFPFTPKQSSIISILTLTIPALALSVWARPGPVPHGSLTRKMVHFVLPATITVSIAGLVVFIYFMVTTRDVHVSQNALSYMMIICGLLLIIFVEPPTEAWVGGDTLSGDPRPTWLAIGMFIALIVFMVVPPLRDLYDLVLFPHVVDYLVIAVVAVMWAFSVRFIWRRRLIDRYLNIDLSSAGGIDKPSSI